MYIDGSTTEEDPMPKLTIYHNPRCSKSRQTLKIIEESGKQPEIIEYLKTPPDAETLNSILTMLGCAPEDIIRKKEPIFKELGLNDGEVSRERLIEMMIEHPILIERPIVVKGERAVLGRPPENVRELL